MSDVNAKAVGVADYEGEEAQVLVGDFGPFGIELILFQVLRDKRKWYGKVVPTWVTLYSCTLGADDGLDQGYTYDQWVNHMADAIRRELLDRRAKAEARARFYSEGK